MHLRLLLSLLLAASLPAQTTVTLGPETLRTQVTRFGINLSGQNYYDSGQLSRNLVVRNPGFEAQSWQSILRCKTVTPTTCTDQNPYTTWPADFLRGARAEPLSGPAAGEQLTVTSSTKAADPNGVTLTLTGLRRPLTPGDFLLVHLDQPGTPEAGWWPSLTGAARLSAETRDLSPRTPGRQALRIEAIASKSSAHLKSYFDTASPTHSFVQLRTPYQLRFRAKPLAGKPSLHISLLRVGPTRVLTGFLDQDVPLKPGWNDYLLTTGAVDSGLPAGAVELSFNVESSTLLLDDVSLTPVTRSPANPTAFRDEVVSALRDLHPGLLRLMDNGTSFASSLDNLLADTFARQRTGFSTQDTVPQDIPLGLHDFLVLCETVGADPWLTLPPGFSQADAVHLIEYLAAPAGTPYGGRRAALGHPAPWTQTFRTIHLELGNEQWNNRSFSGATLNDPVAYGQRAATIFQTLRASPGFEPRQFDLVMGTWSAVPWYTQQELMANKGAADTVAIAPYLFSEFNDASSSQAVFGPMFSQPEEWDSHPGGQVAQQLSAARSASPPARLAVYEVNLGTAQGTAPQSAIDATVPSLGGALAVADHMLLMLCDLGITTQALFALPEYANSFAGGKSTPLWGAVVDMGGSTNLRRPTYLALQLINEAILPNLIATHLTGAPTWQQPASQNDHIPAALTQTLQTFAFADGQKRNLILINLSRTRPEPIRFAGPNAPTGQVRQTILTAAHITDSNEKSEQVRPVSTTLPHSPAATILPPFSLTVLAWTAHEAR